MQSNESIIPKLYKAIMKSAPSKQHILFQLSPPLLEPQLVFLKMNDNSEGAKYQYSKSSWTDSRLND